MGITKIVSLEGGDPIHLAIYCIWIFTHTHTHTRTRTRTRAYVLCPQTYLTVQFNMFGKSCMNFSKGTAEMPAGCVNQIL